MPKVSSLGHVGLYVHDLPMMRDWYRDTLGLTVTDEDLELGIVFFSAHPESEHHELALQRGRATPISTPMVQQVSWHVDSVEELQGFHRLFQERSIAVQQEVTHGNAVAIYFFDPEGNRNEVYYSLDRPVPQPFRKTINLEQSPEAVLAESDRLAGEGGAVYQAVTTRPA
jgi:catechol-2,3-dioxygenase